MAKRRNMGGRYVETRERSTSKGDKGTIMGNWSSKTQKEKKKENSQSIIYWIIILILLLLFIYYLIVYM